MKVVSLLPSATEIVCLVGGRDRLVGRSHECDAPAGIEDVPVLTTQRTTVTDSLGIDRQVRALMSDVQSGPTLYELDAELLRTLEPDVILTQSLCGVCSIDRSSVEHAIERLPSRPRVVSLEPRGIEDVFEDVLRVGSAIGCEAGAQTALVGLRERYWTAVDYVNPYVDGPQTVVLEWIDPLFVAGHWTPQLVAAAGGRHDLNPSGVPARVVEPDELLAIRPERLIVCPCGLDARAVERERPTLEAAGWWPMLPAVQRGHVAFLDGTQHFSRPGPRLVETFRWLVGWLNDRPELLDGP